jgi:tellurite resistance protein
MAFDIRAIFARSFGGRTEREEIGESPEPEALTDEEMPESPITAAGSSAASPDTDDMTQGGATPSSILIPGGIGAIPTAAIDRTSASEDEIVSAEQAHCVAEIAIAAAMVHGPLPKEERDDLVETLREVPGLEDIDDSEIRAISAELLDSAGSDDASDFISAMEDRLDELSDTLRDPALRRVAYQLAVYFCAWDGILSDEENDLLGAFSEAFEIPALEARALRESTMVEAGTVSSALIDTPVTFLR